MQSTKVAVFASSNLQRKHLQSLLEKTGRDIKVVLSEAEGEKFLNKINSCNAEVVLIDFGDEDDPEVDNVIDAISDHSDIPILFNDSGPEGVSLSASGDAWAKKLAEKLVAMAKGSSEGSKKDAVPPVVAAPDLTYIASDVAQEADLNVWVLGASLGGPQAVRQFLSSIDENLPIVFILAQHIGANHISLLAEQLNRVTGFTVLPGKSGHKMKHGEVILTPADKLISFTHDGFVALKPAPPAAVYSPSIDLVLTEVARCFAERAGAIIFSGMGDDGSKGCEMVAARGGIVWAQDVTSCVVSSMPDKARKTGKVSYSARPEQLAAKLYEHFADCIAYNE